MGVQIPVQAPAFLSKGCKAQEQDVFEGQFLMTHSSPLRAGLTGQKEALLMA